MQGVVYVCVCYALALRYSVVLSVGADACTMCCARMEECITICCFSILQYVCM